MGFPKKYILLFLLSGGSVLSLPAQTPYEKTIDSLQALANAAKSDTVRLRHLNLIGYTLFLKGDIVGAKTLAEKLLLESKKLDYKLGQAHAWNTIAICDWAKEDLEKATEELNKAASINEELGNNIELGQNHINLGNIQYVRGNYMEAIKKYKVALKYSELGGYKEDMIIINNNIGDAFQEMGNYAEALKYLFASLKLNSDASVKGPYAMCNMNIGNVYRRINNYTESLKFYKIASENYKYLGLEDGVAECGRFMGEVYAKQGNYTEAIKNYQEAKRVFIKISGDSSTAVARIRNGLGRVYLQLSKFTEAHENFKTAAALSPNDLDKRIFIDAYTGRGETFEKEASNEKDPAGRQNKYLQAIQMLNQALTIANEKDIKEEIPEVYRVLVNVYTGMHNYPEALKYEKLYGAGKDSLLNSENARKMEQLRTQYEVESAVTDEKLKQEQVLVQQKAAKQRKENMLMAGFAIFILLSAFIGLLFQQRNQKRKAIEKAEAGHKMAELELQSLRAQLNPHFMFNSLNAIQDLILKEDNHRSHLYLSRFAKLLRVLLDNATQPFVSLKQEMEFLELYLSLENLRIPDLKVSIDKDPALNMEKRMVPNMMLQPYIENAIWHGLSGKKGERKLHIRICENANATEFEIEDNGIGREKAAAIKVQNKHGHHSKGMELLSKRFSLLSSEYGEAIDVSIADLYDNGEATGTLVRISVPFNLSEQARNSYANDTNHHS